MKKILIIAPHPDDETLGCGGTILKHKVNGDKIFWLIATSMQKNDNWTKTQIRKREIEIKKVYKQYNFDDLFFLKLKPRKVDEVSTSLIIDKMSKVIKQVHPDIIYGPNINDVHTDHQILAKALASFGKSFRYNFIKEILSYETLSETDFNIYSKNNFKPNLFNDISKFIEKKIDIMKIYESELLDTPHPRSIEAIKSLAIIRGSQSGFKYAEAFKILFKRCE